jgi:cell division protein FtsI (penicillin-binding protein 3)
LQEVKIPKDGKDIRLSIDKRLQHSTYQSLEKAVEKHEAKSGSAILIEAKTGQILAMVNYPAYNPNSPIISNKYLRNRVMTDVFEPGSTIKPISIAAALEQNVIKPHSKINTYSGFIKVGKRTITDTHKNGVLTVKQVIQKSSNVGATIISQKISSKKLWTIYNDFGFGSKTGVQFPGEVSGKLKGFKGWKEVEHATMSYGYGFNASLAQIVRSYIPFANKGVLKPLTLFKSDDAVVGKRVLSVKTSNQVLNMMESVVSIDGTASQAMIQGYRVAGKTGTAKKLNSNGDYGNKYIGSFVGLAPASKPKFVMAIMIDEPTKQGYYGGVIAGPVFKDVMSYALKIYSIPQDGFAIETQKNQDRKNADNTI